MKVIYCFLAALVVLVVSACSAEESIQPDVPGEIQTLTVIGPAPIQFESITGRSDTKGTSVQDGSALLFNWAVGDTLGIFPNKGNQVEFPISAAQGSTSASFDGGGWALRNNASYAGYYPFSVWNYHRDNETILLDYSGQVQDGNGSFAHLSKYDFLASNKTTPQGSAVTFQMERQGSILYIDIVVPEPETITSLTISCDEAIFVEKASLNISGETPVVTPIKTTESLTLSFKNTATTSSNETVRAYMAVQPVDFTQKTVTATLTTESGSYTAPVTSRVVNKGRAAFLRFADDFEPVNIEFADAEVKRICVENWDTNGDGELSYKEAAAVTDIGLVFFGQNIVSFNELQYFNSLQNIGISAFSDSSIEQIVLPSSLVKIEGYAFYRCNRLKQIAIPNSVSTFGSCMFSGCSSLERIDGYCASNDGHSWILGQTSLHSIAPAGLSEYSIPNGVTTVLYGSISGFDFERIIIPEGVVCIEEEAIVNCDKITSITLPNSLDEIGRGNFWECNQLSQFIGKFASDDGRCLIDDDAIIACACAGLSEYSIPNNVHTIGKRVFCDAPLTTVSIPNNVSTIEYGAFESSAIAYITLPNELIEIGGSAFFGCNNLSEITIPSKVEVLGEMSFFNCMKASQIIINRTEPCEIGRLAFGQTNNCPIYVPSESVEAYKAAPGWSEYADRIVGMDVEGTVVGPEPQNPD